MHSEWLYRIPTVAIVAVLELREFRGGGGSTKVPKIQAVGIPTDFVQKWGDNLRLPQLLSGNLVRQSSQTYLRRAIIAA